MMGTLDDLTLELDCPFCGAKPEEWCRSVRPISLPPGQRARYLHQSRADVVWQAWRRGHRVGAEWVVHMIDTHQDGEDRDRAWLAGFLDRIREGSMWGSW